MNYADTTGPQPPTPGVSAFDNRVEMQWPGTGDDANGSGLYVYQMDRRAALPSGERQFVGSFRRPNMVEYAVSPGTAYEYRLWTFEYHHYYSGVVTFNVTTAPAGTTDPRRVGVRPEGSYWGGAGEQIDVISGNLSFSSPPVTGQARGGMRVPFRLHYNSQIWRKDPGGIWKLARDNGFGHIEFSRYSAPVESV